MGTYAGHADCEAFWADVGTLDSNTEPTDTNTDTRITHLESMFENAARARGYTIPVVEATSPDSFLRVREAITCAATLWILMQRGYVADLADPSTAVGWMQEKWDAFMEGVRTVPGFLEDAEVGEGGPETPVHKGFRSLWSDDSEAVDKRAFERGMKY